VNGLEANSASHVGGLGVIYIVGQGLIYLTAFVLYVNWLKSKSVKTKIIVNVINALLIVGAWFFLLPNTKFVLKFLFIMIFNVFLFIMMWLRERARLATVEALDDQLVNALLILSGSLKAGRTLQQAFELVAISLPSPISDEFNRVLQDQHVGIPFEDALKNMLHRVKSKDFKTFVTATLFQKETGGNIISLYDQITFAVAERKKLKGRLDSITVQGRWSGYLLAVLPVVLFMVLYFLNPGYMRVFFDASMPGSEIARILLMLAVLLEIVGILVIRNLIDRRLE